MEQRSIRNESGRTGCAAEKVKRIRLHTELLREIVRVLSLSVANFTVVNNNANRIMEYSKCMCIVLLSLSSPCAHSTRVMIMLFFVRSLTRLSFTVAVVLTSSLIHRVIESFYINLCRFPVLPSPSALS